MKRIIALISIALLCFTSCSVMQNNINKEKTYLSVKIFQTLNKNAALARTDRWDVVKIESLEEMYYDGKSITGTFVLVDTYSYETKDGTIKTVPVYIRESEYRKLKEKPTL